MPGFNASGFMQAKLTPRTNSVPVPALADWFGGDAASAAWTVRGLTGNELARVNEAEQRNRKESALIEALADGSKSEIVGEMQRVLGRTNDTQPDIARRLELLTLGSVDPECSEELAVRLCERYPVAFYELTNAVLELTGRGSETEKKPVPSTETRKSAPA